MLPAPAFNPDGIQLAGTSGRAARVWATTTEIKLKVTHDGGSVPTAALSPDRTRLATAAATRPRGFWTSPTDG